jgi:ATP/maltotriose-dependent transcriptional regulator MalT
VAREWVEAIGDSPAGNTQARSLELLERSQQLAVLDDALATVLSDRRGRLVLLGGEAGVGKTAVVRRFCDQRGPPSRILWGACEALFTPRALGPFVDVSQLVGGELEDLLERLRERGARGLPRGPRARTRANPAGLTPRELEVLALVADGLRNAEIAQRLVLSAKTVDHHVSAILRKLEVRTRGEAGAAAERLGLTTAI